MISGKKYFFISLLTLLAAFQGCANQMSPSGGDIDRIPPKITASYPVNGTTNFRENSIEFEFSEYVDKRSVQDAVFISPSVDGTPEYDWSGAGVRITLPGKLKDSVTYIVTVGTEAVDVNNKNKMAQAYSLTFSTGDKIDKGIIEGKIFDEKPSGVMLLAYKINRGEDINPSVKKPDYISQSGSDGSFRIAGLAPGDYTVIAVRESFSDLLYNKGSDEYGCPDSDITISEQDTLFRNLDFFITKEDTVAPRLLKATMTDRNHAILEFSEEYDSLFVSSDNFGIIDSTLNKTVRLLYVFRGKTKSNELALAFNDSIAEGNNYYIVAKNIKDLAGNITGIDYTQLTSSLKADTSAPKLFSVIPGASEKLDPKDAAFQFYFDDGFDSLKAIKGIEILDKSKNKIPFSVRFIDDASFIVRARGELKNKSDYMLNMDLKNITDAAGRHADSLYSVKFSTSLGTEYSGLSGTVETEKDSGMTVILRSSDSNKKKYTTKTTRNKKFEFPKVEPGKYLLWGFDDKNSNGKYDHGRPYPMEKSEKFIYYSDTLNLRARWPVSDVVLKKKK